jgi:integrase
MAALKSMLQKKHAASDFVFHQTDGTPWAAILESFRSLLKRCGLNRSGVHILRHTFGAHLAQKGVNMAVIRDLLGHAQRHADWKVLRASGAGKIEIRRTKIATDAEFSCSVITENGFCTIFGH